MGRDSRRGRRCTKQRRVDLRLEGGERVRMEREETYGEGCRRCLGWTVHL